MAQGTCRTLVTSGIISDHIEVVYDGEMRTMITRTTKNTCTRHQHTASTPGISTQHQYIVTCTTSCLEPIRSDSTSFSKIKAACCA